MPLTRQQKRRLLSNDLNDAMVRQLLAGFLSRHLAETCGVKCTPQSLEAVFEAYVENIKPMLDQAVSLHEQGFRGTDEGVKRQH